MSEELKIVLEVVRVGGYPVMGVLIVYYLRKPIGIFLNSLSHWISKKSMEKHAGEDIAGQVSKLRKTVGNDMTHELADINKNIENIWKFCRSLDDKIQNNREWLISIDSKSNGDYKPK